jgi:AcrR family transcriptional regulator
MQRVWRHARERRALIAVATDLFWRDRFGATGLRAIAAAAGCPECAIHREFGGKAGLLASVIDWPETLDSGDSTNLHQDILQLVQREVTRIRHGRTFLRRNLHPKCGALHAQRPFPPYFAFSGRAIDEYLQRHEQLGNDERRFLLCAIQAVGYALSLKPAGQVGWGSASCRVREFANILADGIERQRGTGRPTPRLV